jgi:lipoate---protein ligase
MSQSWEIHLSNVQSPYWNLALEKYLLEKRQNNILLLYRNRPSIICGHFQNIYKEVQCLELNKKDIWPVRRRTGGGTVYHDLGNLNFSFIRPKLLIKENLSMMIDFLGSLNIQAEMNKRNDLIVRADNRPYKISGNAFRQTKWGSIHHGTLLINANLERLKGVLQSSKSFIECKGIQSVKSSVLNLEKFQPESIGLNWENLICDFFNCTKPINSISHWDIESLEKKEEILTEAAHLASWSWIIGHGPKWIEEFSLNLGESELPGQWQVHKGHLSSVSFEGVDDIHPGALNLLAKELEGRPFKRDSINQCWDNLEEQFKIFGNSALSLRKAFNSII